MTIKATGAGVHPRVREFMGVLAQTESIAVDDVHLHQWESWDATGDPTTVLLTLAYAVQPSLGIVLKLTEGVIAAGRWVGDSFFCEVDGSEEQLTFYKHVAIKPGGCKQCGSPLDGEHCTDTTCCYFDWPQSVSFDDIKAFTTEEIEQRYGLKKREQV